MVRRARTLYAAAVFLAGILSGSFSDAQRVGPPSEGVSFPDIVIPAPSSAEAQKYLGLKAKGTFKVSQIKAELVIFEIFSMYCPHCQREAPSVNALYQLIDSRPDLKGKIKIVGLGAGNSSFEVDLFSKKYNIPFPLIPDADLLLHRALGEVRTPYFIAVKLSREGQSKVVYSKVGSPGDPGQFLELLLQRAKAQ
ncbi:MAG: peroxiredoxin family protein [Syntrophobacteraceae bacterium]